MSNSSGRKRKPSTVFLLLGLLTLVLREMARRHSPAVEKIYFLKIYPVIREGLSILFGYLEFPIAPAITAFFSVFSLFHLFKTFKQKSKSLVWLINLALTVAAWAAGFLFFFYFLWGWNYYKTPLSKQLELTDKPLSSNFLYDQTKKSVFQLNRLRQKLKTEKLIQRIDTSTLRLLTKEVDKHLTSFLRRYGFPTGAVVPVRFFPFSALAMKFGGPGLYFPFTGEIYLPSLRLAVEYPFLIAHELAHARGFAHEAEANFLGFIACQQSRDPLLAYSGMLALFSYLQSDLCRASEKQCQIVQEELSFQIQADRQAIYQNQARYENQKWSHAASAINNAYLRSQDIPEGVLSYNRAVELYLHWKAANIKKTSSIGQ